MHHHEVVAVVWLWLLKLIDYVRWYHVTEGGYHAKVVPIFLDDFLDLLPLLLSTFFIRHGLEVEGGLHVLRREEVVEI